MTHNNGNQVSARLNRGSTTSISMRLAYKDPSQEMQGNKHTTQEKPYLKSVRKNKLSRDYKSDVYFPSLVVKKMTKRLHDCGNPSTKTV